VVSDRAIEYSSRIQDVLLGDAPADRLARISKHTFFTIASEEALQQGQTEIAVKALAMSVVDPGLKNTHIYQSAIPHQAPSRLRVLAMWCFGLLHELGHLAPDRDYGHLTTDDAILGFLGWASREWFLESGAIGDASERARRSPESSVIGLEHLRSEVRADLFAIEALLEAATAMMNELREPFDWKDFIREAHAAQQAVVVFDRIRRAVALGASPAPTHDDAIEMMLQPISIAVRNLAQQELIVRERIIAIAAPGDRPSLDDVNRERQFVHDCLRPSEARYRVFDVALDTTIDYVLNLQRQTDQWALLEQLAAAVRVSTELTRLVARFVSVAEGLGRSSSATLALRMLIDHPNRALTPG